MKRWTEAAFFVREQREEVNAWCKTHNIDPMDVPIRGLMREGQSGYIEIEVFDRDEFGHIKPDFSSGEQLPAFKWYAVRATIPAYLLEDVEM